MGCFLYPWLQGCTAKCCSRFDSGCRGFLFATRMGGLYLSLLEEGQTVALLPKEEKNKEEVKICYLRFCLMEKSEHPQAIWSAFPRRILCRIWSIQLTNFYDLVFVIIVVPNISIVIFCTTGRGEFVQAFGTAAICIKLIAKESPFLIIAAICGIMKL